MLTWKENVLKLKSNLAAIYLALKRKDTPILAKGLAAITIGYALSPIDLIPDFIPLLGYLDDIIILPVLIWVTLKVIPQDIMKECLLDSREMWKDKRPKHWIFGLLIILIWLFILIGIYRLLRS